MNTKLKQLCDTILEQTTATFPNENLMRLKDNMEYLLHPEHAIQPTVPGQSPTFHYYVGLTDKPWWELELIPRVELLLHKDKIKAELNHLLTQKQFTPFSLNVHDPSPPAYLQGDMNTYHIIRDLDPDQSQYKLRQQNLPSTMAFLHSIPGLAEDAFFSCLTPGTHLKKHAAEDNVRLNVHLGLEIPKQAAISVAGQERKWPDEGILCFDPSFMHEAWNFDTCNRYILLWTIWHPDLTPAEILALRLFSQSYQHCMS